MTALPAPTGDLAVALKGELARTSFVDYCRAVSPGFEVSQHTKYICDLFSRAIHGSLRRVICTAPPGFGKSTVQQCAVSFSLSRAPGFSALMLSASESLAIRNARVVRSHIMSDASPFPEVRISEDSSAIADFSTNTLSTAKSKGAGAVVTGMRFRGAFLDDLQSDAGSSATIDTLEEYFRSVLTTRLEPDAFVIMIQTRWGTNDLVARLMEGESADQWLHVNLRALGQGDDPLGIDRAVGESLWPSRWPVEILLQRKAEVGSLVFEGQYNGNPTPEGSQLFPPSFFVNRYTELPREQSVSDAAIEIYRTHGVLGPHDPNGQPFEPPLLRVTGVDSALKDKPSSDFTCFVTVSMTSTEYFVEDCEMGRWPFDEILQRLIAHYERVNSFGLLIEDTALGAPAISAIKAYTKLPCIAVQPLGSKFSRWLTLVPLAEAGKIRLPKHAAWLPAAETQLFNAPAGRNDDFVDALEIAISYLRALRAREQVNSLLTEQLRGLFGR